MDVKGKLPYLYGAIAVIVIIGGLYAVPQIFNKSKDESPLDIPLESNIELVLPKDEKVIDFGKLIVLRPTPVDYAQFSSVSFKWVLLDIYPTGSINETFYVSNAEGVDFSSGLRPKVTHVTLFVTGVYSKSRQTVVKTVVKTRVLTVGGELPLPPDPPGPRPDPVPPVPVDPTIGLTPLGKAVYVAAQKIDPKARVIGAKALAESFSGIASSIAAGALKTPKDILISSKDSNISALKSVGINPASWESFSRDLEVELTRLLQAGMLDRPEQYKTKWEEIAQGLAAIK